ncbi:MAG: hypothetical protein MZV64_72805 [Ignavibacteriales bacterium]|nr:hypothetical protein [Ignavibacteriales bacterium]
MQVELFVMQRRVQARLSTPWLEFEAAWLARQLGEGRPILRFDEIPFDWGEFRTLFRQVSEVLRRYDLLEPADGDARAEADSRRPAHQGRCGVPGMRKPRAAGAAAARRASRATPEAVGQILALSARPFLARTVETLHQRVDLAPWTRPYCPFCGGDAELALLLRPGETRLACGRCTGVWPFPEHACPHCDNRLPARPDVVRQPRRPLPPHWLRRLPPVHQGLRCRRRPTARSCWTSTRSPRCRSTRRRCSAGIWRRGSVQPGLHLKTRRSHRSIERAGRGDCLQRLRLGKMAAVAAHEQLGPAVDPVQQVAGFPETAGVRAGAEHDDGHRLVELRQAQERGEAVARAADEAGLAAANVDVGRAQQLVRAVDADRAAGWSGTSNARCA